MFAYGYKQTYGEVRQRVRFTPESGHSSDDLGWRFNSADYPCARRASNQATAKSVIAAKPKAS